jgi:hypothetical protein
VIGLYMKDFFDYGIADEVHELSNDTAQGNALGTLARSVDKIAVLTGTLMGGYADDLFNVFYRLEPHKMVAEGFEWGESGVRSFAETYGVLERITIITPEENACSKAKVTRQVKRKPGASPLLFGKANSGAEKSVRGVYKRIRARAESLQRFAKWTLSIPQRCQKMTDHLIVIALVVLGIPGSIKVGSATSR